MNDLLPWLLESDEPWTRYRTLIDLLDRTEDDPEVQSAREEMLSYPLVLRIQKRIGKHST